MQAWEQQSIQLSKCSYLLQVRGFLVGTKENYPVIASCLLCKRINEKKQHSWLTWFLLLPLGWLAGPGVESTDKGTVFGFSCIISCYGNLARICRPMVSQPFPVPPPVFLYHPHQVCIRMKEKTQMSNFTECGFAEIYTHCSLWRKLILSGSWRRRCQQICWFLRYHYTENNTVVFFLYNVHLAGVIRISNPLLA